MASEMKKLQAIRYNKGKLEVLDQLSLPAQTKYISIAGVEDGWKVISKMQVRGAPAIAIVGCLSLAVEIYNETFITKQMFKQEIEGKLNYLVSARPTAVNMKLAADDLIGMVNDWVEKSVISVTEIKERFIHEIEAMLEKDISNNMAIGTFGAERILKDVPSGSSLQLLTHCNTGSLATAGYGTALGVIRKIFDQNRLEHVFCTETRPYNQGARLTAYEFVHDKIPATLVLDSMVASLFKSRKIAAVVVGADRVASNGDTANKIGTYQIAVVAKHHAVPFYVAAPSTSIDFEISEGDRIEIEQRPDREMTHIGEHRIAAPGIRCWNPAFDVTPANLITGIITEKGVFAPNDIRKLLELQ
ncbi:methylthioribose-1-phosphate isomerase isoform X2 [Culex quinquefasciatus]|uniref:methylthioribose-1-phosphate isomerase isoform X2 n=1 Tax=Culex quinquefasciatus TaxID=7176 RepID=UPI0018E3993D|nr:methylthioribose-1-phosphate isomerase isoform X2 [Culex quinquefasciatus]